MRSLLKNIKKTSLLLTLIKIITPMGIAEGQSKNVLLKCFIGFRGSQMETKLMVDYSKSFIGKPYLWGGEGPEAYDCSGFIQEVLSCIGYDPTGDQTAQGLYNYFSKTARGKGIAAGSLLFWGKSINRVTHVSMAINFFQHIEAGGGGRAINSLQKAKTSGAMIRIRPIVSRNDLLAAIKI